MDGMASVLGEQVNWNENRNFQQNFKMLSFKMFEIADNAQANIMSYIFLQTMYDIFFFFYIQANIVRISLTFGLAVATLAATLGCICLLIRFHLFVCFT